jgi:hypothetical protein
MVSKLKVCFCPVKEKLSPLGLNEKPSFAQRTDPISLKKDCSLPNFGSDQ